MAKLFPQATVNALRSFANLSIDNYGIDCQLFVVNNTTTNEPKDIYKKPEDVTYSVIKTRVFIEWKPDTKRLRKLGLFTEGDLPIIAWFKNVPDVPIGSYIKVDTQYIPALYDRDEFEIVDVLIRGMYDAIVLHGYKLAPRRVKSNLPISNSVNT